MVWVGLGLDEPLLVWADIEMVLVFCGSDLRASAFFDSVVGLLVVKVEFWLF